MAITHNFKVGGVKVDNLDDYARQCKAVIDAELIRTLTRMGEEGVAYAKDRPQEDSWNNRTGNLRSSIGYAVYSNRQQVMRSAFLPTPSPEGNGELGKQYGEMALVRAAKKINHTDTALVLVAGMHYAHYVEAMKNKDVLASAELMLRAKFPTYLQKTKDRIKTLIGKL